MLKINLLGGRPTGRSPSFFHRINHMHVPHEKLRKFFGLEILSFGSLSSVGMALIGFHRFVDAVFFFSLACAVVGIQILIRTFTIHNWWPWKIVAVAAVFVAVIWGDRYLVKVAIGQMDDTYAESVSRDADASRNTMKSAPLVKSAPLAAEHPPLPLVPPLTRHIQHPTGFLGFDTPEAAGSPYNEIAVGKQFGMNFRSRNNSPERVLRTFGYTAAFILPATDESDKVALDKSADDLRTIRKKYIAGEIHGPEIPAGANGIWGTAFLHLHSGLTQPEVDGIISKRLRIYYVSRLVWTDLQNRMDWSDDCRWLQVPDAWPYSGELVWHFCDLPN